MAGPSWGIAGELAGPPGPMPSRRCTVSVFEHTFDHPASGVGDLDPRPHRAGSPGDRAPAPRGARSMRRYDDPVETRMGLISGVEGPEQFLWRGRLWEGRGGVAPLGEAGPGGANRRARAG